MILEHGKVLSGYNEENLCVNYCYTSNLLSASVVGEDINVTGRRLRYHDTGRAQYTAREQRRLLKPLDFIHLAPLFLIFFSMCIHILSI